MGKPLTTDRKKGLKCFKFDEIIAQASTKNQASRFLQLSKSIARHELTDALEILEQSGLTEDLAVFAIGCLQREEAA